MRQIGLARVLSKRGYCSRSRAFELIRGGYVKLNGRICREPETPVHLERDQIEVRGSELLSQTKIYLMLNKPRGVITSAADERGRKTVYAFLKPCLSWVAPVGRLDKGSEGLLLLTNDSEWGARLSAPESHIDKTYHVQIGCVVNQEFTDQINAGIKTKDGELLRAKSARVLRKGEKNSWLEIVLDEGKNRHIRRMLEMLGVEVRRLVRVAVGPLVLGDLPKGSARPLTVREKRSVDAAMRAGNHGT
ncbi:MAG TPA: pseudouridine synthase [Terriglobales bacterium]|nr:pseudouridine synthase [Terriglobales bacterium]